ncbi:MAG TPA: hypothetical protein VGZ29_13045 [Terriglobia bacterium]|nr:hypothetical protein [Terriglobia bacterium]
MLVHADLSALRRTRWHEYLVRFLFGGAITAATGWVGHEWGPGVAGLFLAFPAIFPAAATLIEAHEKRRKHDLGLRGTRRGREAAALDASGAARGSSGLLVFGLLVWWLIPDHSAALVLGIATGLWLVTATLGWKARHLGHRFSPKRRSGRAL